jgi:hypothetical protein
MIALLLSNLSQSAIFAARNSDGGPLWLLALGPGGAAALYFGMWSYYRNTGKSHSFETDTRVEAKPVTGHEAKVNQVNGTRATRINGDNRSEHRKRVERSNPPN